MRAKKLGDKSLPSPLAYELVLTECKISPKILSQQNPPTVSCSHQSWQFARIVQYNPIHKLYTQRSALNCRLHIRSQQLMLTFRFSRSPSIELKRSVALSLRAVATPHKQVSTSTSNQTPCLRQGYVVLCRRCGVLLRVACVGLNDAVCGYEVSRSLRLHEPQPGYVGLEYKMHLASLRARMFVVKY